MSDDDKKIRFGKVGDEGSGRSSGQGGRHYRRASPRADHVDRDRLEFPASSCRRRGSPSGLRHKRRLGRPARFQCFAALPRCATRCWLEDCPWPHIGAVRAATTNLQATVQDYLLIAMKNVHAKPAGGG
ncbi:MAG: hypothetical protein E5X74_23800 [Mesorhizobium sp.]|nr:MAG: hypothetical protein EOR74_18970 [Mesorhizobium sp.]RWM38883.1 MAG: hypothetical protein EOR75_17205 [Mesorhizobium sp.]TIO82702.1 MAG: hypothetical protein E5X74_23800 [Mesorhizobium sp.]TJV51513.1 MAG: hypothetical protein E5Y01_14790 [Mesorhizobium sp.]